MPLQHVDKIGAAGRESSSVSRHFMWWVIQFPPICFHRRTLVESCADLKSNIQFFKKRRAMIMAFDVADRKTLAPRGEKKRKKQIGCRRRRNRQPRETLRQ